MRWQLPDPVDADAVRKLAAECAISPWIAALLIRRGLGEAAAAKRFLEPRLRSLGDPFALGQMRDASEALLGAIDDGKRIVLYGDYDVDGVTSLAILTRVLRALGAEVTAFLPHRIDEGYGLSADGVTRCIQQHSPGLLLAVDCGTTSIAEVERLRAEGVPVVILDHHEPAAVLPAALALVNPKVHPSGHDWLCSAGLAFKLAHALLKLRPVEGFDLREVLDLVALGTVADIVPLVEENRILVRAGLERMKNSAWPGLRALIAASGLKAPHTAADINFGLGPRLNAAGRLAAAETALELLLTPDEARAAALAATLDGHNRDRRQLEDEVFQQALAQAFSIYDAASDEPLVLGDTGWHPGVVGIVASRIQRHFHRPAVVIGFAPSGVGKGSARSISGVSLIAALRQCAACLEKFGGHEMAAGVTLRRESLADFRAALTAAVREQVGGATIEPLLVIDARLPLDAIEPALLEQQRWMEPFGAHNPQPVFLAPRVMPAAEPLVMKEKHFSLLLRSAKGNRRAVWWNAAGQPLPEPPWDVAFSLERNVWNGNITAQMNIRDLCATGAKADARGLRKPS